MIPHLGICATAASTSYWLLVVPGNDRRDLQGVFFYSYTTENPSLNFIFLYIMLGYGSVSCLVAH